jgi:hypothetical protein
MRWSVTKEAMKPKHNASAASSNVAESAGVTIALVAQCMRLSVSHVILNQYLPIKPENSGPLRGNL